MIKKRFIDGFIGSDTKKIIAHVKEENSTKLGRLPAFNGRNHYNIFRYLNERYGEKGVRKVKSEKVAESVNEDAKFVKLINDVKTKFNIDVTI